MRDFRRAVTTGAAALTTALLLSGCTATPEFSAPIRWATSSRLVNADGLGPLEARYALPDDMTVQLDQHGTGYAERFPRGTIDTQADGTLCLDVSDTGTYTGEITWRTRSEYSLTIEFDGSELILATNPGKFGSQDWSEVRIWPCDLGNAYWRIGIECGSLGERIDAAYGIEPCSPPE